MSDNAKYLYEVLEVDRFAAMLHGEKQPWGEALPAQAKEVLAEIKHGSLQNWLNILRHAPDIDADTFDLNSASIGIRSKQEVAPEINTELLNTLQALKPWRKGPYALFDTYIDTEWRSDKKWNRIKDHVDLGDKNVLDVGCANGYFGWRMLGAGAKSVIGIDPGILFIIQFLLIKHYLRQTNAAQNHFILPYRLEDLPQQLNYFDTAFSMGVLYHRRSVFDHLFELKQCLKPGGELVLETLVIPKEYGQVLVPKDRYARMRNVWFLPNTDVLCKWIARVGFVDIRVIDESDTTLDEQRETQWIDSQSLQDCLDPDDPSLTVEGYPAPKRAIITAYKT